VGDRAHRRAVRGPGSNRAALDIDAVVVASPARLADRDDSISGVRIRGESPTGARNRAPVSLSGQSLASPRTGRIAIDCLANLAG